MVALVGQLSELNGIPDIDCQACVELERLSLKTALTESSFYNFELVHVVVVQFNEVERTTRMFAGPRQLPARPCYHFSLNPGLWPVRSLFFLSSLSLD